MAHRDEIVSFLDDHLRIHEIRDYCPEGLQIEGSSEVSRVALGVTADQEFLDRAQKAGAQLLLVHHGFFWDGEPRTITGVRRRRIGFLLEHDLSLVTYHLSLDRHEESGNNIQIARRLGLRDIEPFGLARGTPIGKKGRLAKETTIDAVLETLRGKLVREKAVVKSGPARISRVGIVSGGAARMVEEAIAEGLDLFITGEIDFTTPAACAEAGIHFVALGHHDSEKLGVQALGKLLEERFSVETTFLDCENPY